jgi:hypothetical protein
MAFGFAQGLYALDASDGRIGFEMDVVNSLIQALLQWVLIGLHRIAIIILSLGHLSSKAGPQGQRFLFIPTLF